MRRRGTTIAAATPARSLTRSDHSSNKASVLEPTNLSGDVTLDERGVLPAERLGQRARDDVLLKGVHRPCNRIVGGLVWPVPGEDLVRLAAEQEPAGGGEGVHHRLAEHII